MQVASTPEQTPGQAPKVTLVVVPREQFSVSKRSLDSIYECTQIPFELIYVDGNSPSALRQWLEASSLERGFTLLQSGEYLSPNHARNWALPLIKTPYVAFLDNDLIVTPGWLESLLRSAEETGAWATGPLYLEGEPRERIIHMAGGVYEFSGNAPRRTFTTEHLLQKERLDDLVTPLVRGPCDFVEFHCVLCPIETFQKLGPLDPALLNTREHLDLCIAIRNAGGSVMFEPTSVVTYKSPPPLERADVGFFWLRWSEDWTRRSLEHFVEAHGLEPRYLERVTIATARRGLVFSGAIALLRRLFGSVAANGAAQFLMRVDGVINRLLIRGHTGEPSPPSRRRAAP